MERTRSVVSTYKLFERGQLNSSTPDYSTYSPTSGYEFRSDSYYGPRITNVVHSQQILSSVGVDPVGRVILLNSLGKPTAYCDMLLFWSSLAGDAYCTNTDQAKSIAYTEALSSLTELVRGNIDLSVDAFQLGQTKTMVEDIVSRTRNLTKFALKFKRKPLKETGKLWLEFQYGIRPTMQTLYEAYNKVYSPPQPKITTLSSRGAAQKDYVKSVNLTTPLPGGAPLVTHSLSSSGRMRCELGVRMEFGALDVVQELHGWSSMNPLSIGWELLPFSFVADWFLDVGGYVRNFETYLGYKNLFRSGWITYSGVSKSSLGSQINRTPVVGPLSGVSSGLYHHKHKDRKPLTGYPVPKLPHFNVDLSSGRLLNAAALLSQFLK
jgi:hypothetical protein